VSHLFGHQKVSQVFDSLANFEIQIIQNPNHQKLNQHSLHLSKNPSIRPLFFNLSSTTLLFIPPNLRLIQMILLKTLLKFQVHQDFSIYKAFNPYPDIIHGYCSLQSFLCSFLPQSKVLDFPS
jgi:hypothetical protein